MNCSVSVAEPEAKAEPAATIPVVPTAIRPTQIIALLLALAALRYSREFIVPLLVALLAAIALAPPVRTLSRVVPRWLAAAIIVMIVIKRSASIKRCIAFIRLRLHLLYIPFSRKVASIIKCWSSPYIFP